MNVCMLLRIDHGPLLTNYFQFMYIYLIHGLAQASHICFMVLVSAHLPGHHQTYTVSRGLPVDTVVNKQIKVKQSRYRPGVVQRVPGS
jgi:hypothetical protein